MSRKPIRWVDALKRIFSPVRMNRRATRLAVERLDDRINPSLTYFPDGDRLVNDGDANSLRAVIDQAHAVNDGDVRIELDFGELYTLTIDNSGGQENDNAEGDLDLQNSGFAGTKTYTFIGVGAGRAPITQTVIDRVFQIIGTNANVVFTSVDISGGNAQDDGTALVNPGETDALGGAILNEGANLTFNNTYVEGNSAIGGAGSDGSDGADASGSSPAENGQDGTAGRNAFGGGLYSVAGTITVQSGSFFFDNVAQGGDGGAGARAVTSPVPGSAMAETVGSARRWECGRRRHLRSERRRDPRHAERRGFEQRHSGFWRQRRRRRRGDERRGQRRRRCQRRQRRKRGRRGHLCRSRQRDRPGLRVRDRQRGLRGGRRQWRRGRRGNRRGSGRKWRQRRLGRGRRNRGNRGRCHPPGYCDGGTNAASRRPVAAAPAGRGAQLQQPAVPAASAAPRPAAESSQPTAMS